MYYTYMLRCVDNSIYTGITVDLERRLKQHACKDKAAAKYTRSRTALKVERAWSSATRSSASKLEYRIKRLSKAEKEVLIKKPEILNEFFNDKLDCKMYKVVV